MNYGEGGSNLTQIKFLDNEDFYSIFFEDICGVQCGDHYDKNNPQHIIWLKEFVSNLYLQGGVAMCLFSDESDGNEPLGFIYLLHDKGLENVACFGKKATISMLAIRDKHQNKGYGTLLCRNAEQFLRECGAECLYTDTPDNPDDRQALIFYIRNGFTPISCHPGENGKDDMSQVYLFKYL